MCPRGRNPLFVLGDSCLFQYDDTKAHEERGDGNPCADGAKAVVVVGRLTHLHLVRLYVNDIVLAEIIYGRVHYVFRAQVHVVALRFCAFLAEHEDIVATAVDGQVARCANGFDNGQAGLSDVCLPGFLTSPRMVMYWS